MKYVIFKFTSEDERQKLIELFIRYGFKKIYRGQGYSYEIRKNDSDWRLHAVFSSSGFQIHEDIPFRADKHKIKKDISKKNLSKLEKIKEVYESIILLQSKQSLRRTSL